jgi:hypothetical protein
VSASIHAPSCWEIDSPQKCRATPSLKKRSIIFSSAPIGERVEAIKKQVEHGDAPG